MGRPLYNRIHLGRRNALFNLRRLRAAAGLFMISLVALAAWIFAIAE